ncbi:MAG: tRNA guanosine(34) transglycosylase Tgt [Anaerolineae bacterium]|nr:tRNA guanosine(34) transglycosylase Tgt [Anaerolineae bacterium]
MHFRFSLLHTDATSHARLGRIATPHGEIATPAFAPVGTQATVKALDPRDLHELGAELILSNTYHLYLRPGADIVARLGGLHQFMGWDGPILTDSGGFQVFSLAGRRTFGDNGVLFRSHIDGSQHLFTPEMVVRVQEQLGADIIMCLDECAEPHDRAYNEQALARTHAWAERCLAAHSHPSQALFGIVQGGIWADLRQQSAEYLTGLDFPGYAIGGLSVGESKAQMYAILDVTAPLLPASKPRYLMGVGAPEDLLEGVARGIDLFDCVLPTRLARNAALFTRQGRINLRNARFEQEPTPVEKGCCCYTCRRFSLAYLHHLFKAEELLAYRLATIHNVHFLLQLMRDIRAAIAQGSFPILKEKFLASYRVIPEKTRAVSRERRGAMLKTHTDEAR